MNLTRINKETFFHLKYFQIDKSLFLKLMTSLIKKEAHCCEDLTEAMVTSNLSMVPLFLYSSCAIDIVSFLSPSVSAWTFCDG